MPLDPVTLVAIGQRRKITDMLNHARGIETEHSADGVIRVRRRPTM